MLNEFSQAIELLLQLNVDVWHIIWVSLEVSISALFLGTLLGLPLGGFVATQHFWGRRLVIILLNSLMSIPTVIVGVLVYLLLTRNGPLGNLNWLFSIKGMILAQTILTTPIIAALSRQIIADGWNIHGETLKALGLGVISRIKWILWDCRFSLSIAILAGFGRAISEVGAVMIVGGNIAHSTRTMTTAISLETSKGDLPLALALGFVLLAIVLIVNVLIYFLKSNTEAKYG
ncbi:MAG: ABC transporter permease [Betaproteobacteria bacterium]|jgi:tungstate transport system permease protein